VKIPFLSPFYLQSLLTSINMTGILGKKLGMTRVMQDDGRVIPISVVYCEPNEVVQVKTAEKDGYPAIVLGFSEYKKPSKTRKFKFLKEFRIKEGETYKIGDKVTLEALKEIKTVSITGFSKGKGFQGVIKRHGFASGPSGHGSHHHREPGSVGTRAKPGRVAKGKKLPGHMGNKQVTIKKVPIIYLDNQNHLIGIKGPVPGATKGLVIIKNE
jgi:large subunit ribosomal protein L3